MITHADIERVYELAMELTPICNDEATERDFVLVTRPHAVATPQFLTRSRRRNYLHKYLSSPSIDELHPIIIAMPNYEYLKQWMLSGMTRQEQDAILK